MKKLLLGLVFIFLSCAQNQKQEAKEPQPEVNYIYDATYLDNFKIGNPELVLKVQEMHQNIIKKDYEMAGSYLADNVVFNLEDGSVIEGKESCMKFMVEGYSSVEIQDYNVAVNFAVTGDNGDEWVLLWDYGTIVTETGEATTFNWMEAFQFENGKIIFMNQFSKTRQN